MRLERLVGCLLVIAAVGDGICAAEPSGQKIGPGFSINLLKQWPAIGKAPKAELATIEMWLQPDSAALARPRSFLITLSNRGGRDTAGVSLTLWQGQVRAHVLGVAIDSSQTLPANGWSHVALTLDPDTINKQATLWLNGKLVARKRILEFWPKTFEVAEMCSDHWNQNRAFSGRLGDVRISSVVRYRKPFRPQEKLTRDKQTTFFWPAR